MMHYYRGAAAASAASSAGGGFPDGWSNYIEITVQAAQVDGDLANFPVYVDLSTLPSSFFSAARSDGGDIRVTAADGTTLLPREVVWIDTGTEAGELHFLAPSVSSSVDTTFRIYYGNPDATEPAVGDPNGRNAVWVDYEAVWHLQDPAQEDQTDSSGNGHHATPTGMDVADNVDVKIGKGKNFDNSAGSSPASEYYDTDVVANGSLRGFFAWMRPDATANHDIGYFDTSSSRRFYLGFNSSGLVRCGYSDGGVSGSGYSTGTIYLVGFTYDPITESLTIYKNGNDDASTTATQLGSQSSGHKLVIGARYNTGGGTTQSALDGACDEVRVPKVLLSGDYIAAWHANQDASGTFYSVGMEQAA